MAEDRQVFRGLNTDLTPDRLGDQAMDLRNVVPASKETIAPRPGVSLVSHYRTNLIGRLIIADGLPGGAAGGVMLVCLNVTDDGAGVLTHQVDGVFRFRPPLLAEDYDAVVGGELTEYLRTAVLGVVL